MRLLVRLSDNDQANARPPAQAMRLNRDAEAGVALGRRVRRAEYEMSGQIVIRAEGYATAAKVHEQTGLPVVVAEDLGPLKLIIISGERQPLVLADDDRRFLVSGA